MPSGKYWSRTRTDDATEVWVLDGDAVTTALADGEARALCVRKR